MSEVVALTPYSLEDVARSGLPDELSGRLGRNRARHIPPLIAADTDLEAINVWLAEWPVDSRTHRAYRKEVQRFYGWVLAYARKPMSSLTREDFDAYRAFMAAPPPSWCGSRNARKTSAEWRPFAGPLSAAARAQSIAILSAFFTYLVRAHYLAGNPLDVMRRKRKAITEEEKTRVKPKLEKYIPLHTFERFVAALQGECERLDGLGKKRSEMERMLMVVRFLANTGLRREELAGAVVGDLRPQRHALTGVEGWLMTVTGKGDKTARIGINPAALAALHRYQRAHGLDPRKADAMTPLVLAIGAKGVSATQSDPLTDQTIYNIVKKALSIGANILQDDYPDDAQVLRAAAPHWFRHTFTTIMSQLGVPLPEIQKQLRHASIATTGIYTHTEDHALYAAVSRLAL